ncbi:hypothetical protein JAAARDRAFT_122365 [Jaapia argillacea MUCL 33604]|uniref:SHSP domain-containing protein n=1 Tax=Jaapia argillacea MUCL 33604 TaxID=933084 RepID=A0A067Q8I1_9AGAM|nr:hypothetical protein JAAARDRAFT_122365 [Jaapia argillacea MUCL 33604]
MSLARQFFREFRPLFRMLEEPIGRSPSYLGLPTRSLLQDPFFTSPASLRPAVDVSEEGNNYVVEAELPGVKKENVEVRIGDGGRSVLIEGKIFSRKGGEPRPVEGETTNTAVVGSSAVAKADQTSTAISTEREFSGTSTFTRTVWLPRPVDSSKVSAKLSHGILTVTIPKAEDAASVKIQVD